MGDAASLADPLLGEGIYYAMRSAQLAAQVTGEALEGALDLSSYTQLIDTQIRGEFRYARLMAEIYYLFLPRGIGCARARRSSGRGSLRSSRGR